MERKILPIHPAQRDVYTDQLIHTDSPHYNIGGYIKLKGLLNVEKFQETVIAAADVFDAFKLRFDQETDEPVCYIDQDYIKQPLPTLDFTGAANPVQSAIEWAHTRFNKAFLIRDEPIPYEEYLLKIRDNEYWFFGRYHHLITDGFGFIVFVKYLAEKYRSLISGEEIHFSYSSYLNELDNASAYYNSSDFQTDGVYWKNKLGSIPQKILSEKYRRRQTSVATSATYVLDLNADQQKLLDTLKVQTQSGIQQLTIAALLIYFGKTSDHSEFVFGIPVHKRTSRQLRNMVGMLSGILPFKGAFEADKDLAALLKEISVSQKADYRHLHYPIGDISRGLGAKAADGYLYQVSVDYEPLNFNLDFGNLLKAEITRVSNEYESNPLQLCWLEYGEGQSLKLQVHYGNTYFSKTEIALFVERILFIIEQFPAGLHENIGAIEIVPAGEKALLNSFNATTVKYPPANNIIELFEAQVLKNPDKIALEFDDRKITYYQLNQLSNQLAHHLKDNGVRHESLVPLCIKRSAEMIIGILGILKAGGAYVPVDPEYPEDRIRFMLEDTDASLVVTSAECNHKIAGLTSSTCILLDSDWSLITQQPVENINTLINLNSLAYVIYTSGSTGKPKGVLVEHGGVVNLLNAQGRYFNVGDSEKILQFSNFCFDASVEQIFLALFNGAGLIILPDSYLLNITSFQLFLREKGITHLHATPGFLENLDAAGTVSLKRMIAGGDTCKKELAARWKQQVDFYNEYGPTETTVTAVEYQDLKDQSSETNSLPIGRPIANTRLYITGKDKSVLPIGETGELYIAGAGVARGYLNRPELTAEKFINDPFSGQPLSKMYATGDLARWLPDGNIEYLGRIDEQVKIRGYRIEPGEIENVLQQYEGVRQAAIVASEDKEGNKRLVGYVVPKGMLDREAIQSFLSKQLPDYMIPAKWVSLESIPLTSNGKVNRKALPEPLAAETTSNAYEAPANELELQLASLWQEILMVEQVGVNDNFFELGGHSLNAIKLSSRIHRMLNIKIAVGAIFSNPSVRQLGKALTIKKQEQFETIGRLPEQAYYPLSHAQQRFWILSHFTDGSAAYNVSNAFIINGSLNVTAFQQAFDAVIERHEILRTVFVEIDGVPMQKVLALNKQHFIIEMTKLQNEIGTAPIIKQWLEADARKPFDLSKGPLLRATIFQLAADEFVLVFNIHHIISDGWSRGILIKEVLQLYTGYATGATNQLAPLPIQYKDYAAWHSDVYSKHAPYWRTLYGKGVPVLNFPVDHERPKVVSFFGAMLHTQLHEALTKGLRSRAVQHNMSLNNLLFALYGLLVARYSKQQEIVVGSLSSGRSHIDLENLAGVFINFLPVKLSPDPSLTLSTYLENCNQALLEAFDHQDYPFDGMVEDCIRQRDAARNPFFDTMVNFHLQNDTGGQDVLQNDQLAATGISIKPYQSIQEVLFQSVLDFKLDIEPVGSTLSFYLSYNTKLFLATTMQTFLDSLVDLLELVVDDPGKILAGYGEWAVENNETPVNTNRESITDNPVLPLNICASFVLEPVKEFVEYWSNEFELNVAVSFAPYNQVFQQLINPQSLLNTGTGINALFIRIDDWLRDKADMPEAGQTQFLNQNFAELTRAIENSAKLSLVPFLVGIVPLYNATKISQAVANFINRLNQELEIFIKQQSRMHLLDLGKIAALYDVQDLYDSKADELGHMPFTQEYYAAIGTYLARKVNAFKGPDYKVIALDCDNTLWDGVCGELGALGITINEDFNHLQEFILEKYNEGFLLVLCSKNNEADVWEVFDRHPGMKIKREQIAAHRINWQPKAGNLLSIAAELNLGTNSFIFLDDSEFEIEQMNDQCPEVLSITLPENSNDFKNFLEHIWAFDTFSVTAEDTKRNQLYQVEKQRKEEQLNHGSLEDFLTSLDIKVNITELTENELERAVQLTLRTNQFNLNGIRKTPGEILAFGQQPGAISRIIDVKDRFGDYGIVGLVLAKAVANTLVIETFLLSCRVLGRKVEDEVLATLTAYAADHELVTITALYRPTEKNEPFREFLQRTAWMEDPVTNTYTCLLKTREKISA
jgi:amino acid adenylation domain-containing protein/FkbH-like protein